MQSISRNWLILLLIVFVGAMARATLSRHMFVPTTKVLGSFPSYLGKYRGRELESQDADADRRHYAPAEIVLRSYSNGQDTPIELFIAPELVGMHSPTICAPYQGWAIAHMSVARVPAIPDLMLDQVVTRSSDYQIEACAYYWRTTEGVVNESKPLGLASHKLIDALRPGSPSFRVQMCIEQRDDSDLAAAWRQLIDFAGVVDPEVQHLLQRAVETGK